MESMSKLIKKCSSAVTCPKCEWTFIPDLKSWKWHKKNCDFMAKMNGRIRAIRKNELKWWREYYRNRK